MSKKERKINNERPVQKATEQDEKPENLPERDITINFKGHLADQLDWGLEEIEQLLDTLEVRSSLVIRNSTDISTAKNFSENAGATLFMTGYSEMLDYVNEDETISISMKNWQELECRINDQKIYQKALNIELANPNKNVEFDPDSRYVELLNKAVLEAVYHTAMKEISIRFSMALAYTIYVGILGVIPAFVSIVSTYIFVDNFNEVYGQYYDYFTDQELSSSNHLTTLEMLAWHALPIAAYYGEKMVRDHYPQMIVILNRITTLFGKYFVHSDLNIIDTFYQMVETDIKMLTKLKNWKAISLKSSIS